MSARLVFWSLIIPAVLFAADPSWKTKPISDWSEEDAHQILTDSPWAGTVMAIISPLPTEDQRREGGNMGLPHGIGYDGFPDDRPRPHFSRNPLDIFKPESDVRQTQYYALRLRWESARPVRAAELKSNAVEAHTSATEGYVMAVYGVPTAKVKGNPKSVGRPLKSQAFLRREGKKDVKPWSVEVFQGASGMVIVYVFPVSAEITKRDRRVEFNARIGRLAISQSFNVEEMQFQGSLEL